MLFKGIVDRLLIKSNASQILVGTSSWREQFADAIKVQVDEDDDDEGSEEGGDEKEKEKKKDGEAGAAEAQDEAQEEKDEKRPSVSDYIIHFTSLFWKILFAFVPPTGHFLYLFYIQYVFL